MAYFGLNIAPIVARATERGDVKHVRHEIRDFDPFSLRTNLGEATKKVARAYANGEGKVYIHCTAGAPPYNSYKTAAKRQQDAVHAGWRGERTEVGGDLRTMTD